jgi:DNA modification methylase
MDRVDFRTGTFYLGDCFDIIATLPASRVDMVLCDLPYGTTRNKWDNVLPLGNLWRGYLRLLKPAWSVVLTAQQPFTSALVMSQTERFRQALIWNKNKSSGHLNSNRRHLTAHEDVLIFGDGKTTYNPQRTRGHKKRTGWKRGVNSENYGTQQPTEYAGTDDTRSPTTVLDFDVVNNDGSNGGRLHPTQKPVALFEYLIRTYTNPGELVLDNTAGSGTTAIAAINSGRRWICIERDPNYFAKAVARVLEAEWAVDNAVNPQ